MKETIIGTGLTKRRQRTVSSKDSDAAERMHEFAQREHWGYDGAAREAAENLAKYLEEKGLPCLDKKIVIEGDQWRYLRDGEKQIDLPHPSRTASLYKYLENEFGYQSFEWYAGRIIELAHQAFDKQNIPAAIELGYLMYELKFKEEREGLAISGIKQIEDNRERGKKPKRRKWAEALAEHLIDRGARDLRAARSLIPGADESAVASIEINDDEGVYLSGKNVICYDPVINSDVGEMTWENFGKRYFRPALKKRGQ